MDNEIPHQCQTVLARWSKKRCHEPARSLSVVRRETVPFALVFFEKQCHRHRQYLLINFISDARRKSLFYLRKPTVLPAQTRFAIATPLRASHLASMR